MIFYFSGNGNTRWVAEEMARRLGEAVEAIPHYLHHSELLTLDPEEPLGICFPVYGWDAPRIVYQFVDLLQKELEAYPPYLYYICTMGDDIGLTGDRLMRHVAAYGWRFDAGFSILMPDTYVCLPSFDIDPADERDQKLSAAPKRVAGIAEVVKERQRGIFQLFRGKHPWVKSVVLGRLFRRHLMTDRKYHVSASCTGCGRCETVCPVDNIAMEGGAPHWLHHCEMCMACYHACPHHAIEWGKQTRGKGQYRFKI